LQARPDDYFKVVNAAVYGRQRRVRAGSYSAPAQPAHHGLTGGDGSRYKWCENRFHLAVPVLEMWIIHALIR